MLDWSELSDWEEYSRLVVALLAMVPIPVVVPLFLGVVGERPLSDKKRIALYSNIGYLATLVVFSLLGSAILDVFGITIQAFQIAGGLLLLVMAFEMMRSDPGAGADAATDDSSGTWSVSLVPLAIPILAGPGAISTVIIVSSDHDSLSHRLVVIAAALLTAVVVYLAMRLALSGDRFFTPITAVVFSRVMGLIVAAIAIEFIMDGVAGHFPDLVIIH